MAENAKTPEFVPNEVPTDWVPPAYVEVADDSDVEGEDGKAEARSGGGSS